MKRHLSVGEGYAPKPLNFKPFTLSLCSEENTSLNQKIGWLDRPISWARVTGLTSLVALFCFCLSVGSASAQDSIQPLTIGDAIPDALWNMPLEVVNHPEGKEVITLGDYRDKKLIILDFWATWCGSCVKNFEEIKDLNSLSNIRLLPITNELKEDVGRFLNATNFNLASVVESNLISFFPHKLIPHFVWIKDGKVFNFTGKNEVSFEIVSGILDGNSTKLITKVDVLDYSKNEPLSYYADRLGVMPISWSTVTPNIPGISSSINNSKSEGKIIWNYTNLTMVQMLKSILNVDYNKIGLDSILKHDENLYCYQIIIPDSISEIDIRSYVISDITSRFFITMKSLLVQEECYVISERPSGEAKISKGWVNSRPISIFIGLLNHTPLWERDTPIFIDETSSSDKVVYFNSIQEIKADPELLKTVLESQGYFLLKEDRPVMKHYFTISK